MSEIRRTTRLVVLAALVILLNAGTILSIVSRHERIYAEEFLHIAVSQFEMRLERLYMDLNDFRFDEEILRFLENPPSDSGGDIFVLRSMLAEFEERWPSERGVRLFESSALSLHGVHSTQTLDDLRVEDPLLAKTLVDIVSLKVQWVPQRKVLGSRAEVLTLVLPIPHHSDVPGGALLIDMDPQEIVSGLFNSPSAGVLRISDENGQLLVIVPGNAEKGWGFKEHGTVPNWLYEMTYQPAKILEPHEIGLIILAPLLPFAYLWFRRPRHNRVSKAAFEDSLKTENHPALVAILDFVHQEFRRDISLDEVAQVAGYSPTYCSSFFRHKTGTTLTAYINTLRAEESARLISSTNWNMAQIAHESGFSNVQYFNRVFKKHHGFPPGHLRRASGEC